MISGCSNKGPWQWLAFFPRLFAKVLLFGVLCTNRTLSLCYSSAGIIKKKKTVSVPSQISFPSIWSCRINITIIIGKKMENYSVQKWVLEHTSKRIASALGKKNMFIAAYVAFFLSADWSGRQHRGKTWRPGFYAFVLDAFVHSFILHCLFNCHFLSAYYGPLCQAFVLDAFVHSFILHCLFSCHFLSAYYGPLCQAPWMQ